MREAIKRRLPFAAKVIRLLYGFLNTYRSNPAYYMPRVPFLSGYNFDQVFFDGYGNHPTQHIARTKRYINLKGSRILVVGCRLGTELELWLKERPGSVVALDYFSHPEEWEAIIRHHPNKHLCFLSGDARKLPFPTGSFDLISSEAVLEHVNPVSQCIDELYRVLRPGKVMYANMGPLFWTYGGAHFEGAFEHLLLPPHEFYQWILKRNRPLEQAECRHYLDHQMFSYWTFDQYLETFGKFDRLYAIVHVSPRALQFRGSRPKEWQALTARHPEKDLLVSGLTVWLRKPV